MICDCDSGLTIMNTCDPPLDFACSLAPFYAPLALGAAEPPTDAKSLAAVLRPELPSGWTLEVREDRVIIRRTKPVEVFNEINRPPFESEAELRLLLRAVCSQGAIRHLA